MKSFSSFALFSLSSLGVASGAGMGVPRYFKTLDQHFCMGVDDHGYMYTYPCHSSLVTRFTRDGLNLVAESGSSAGDCLDIAFGYYASVAECDENSVSQRWEFQPDGTWTGYATQGGPELCLKPLDPGHIRVVTGEKADGGCMTWYDADTGTVGDPIITGLGGQQFKFDGRDDAWYANLAVSNQSNNVFQWNMKFKKFPTCPAGDDMFVSSVAYDFDNGQTVVIATTPDRIARCENEVCLGDGTLHISFDGGETFVSNPSDYSFGVGNRVVAHNTYDACSRKWFDYDVSQTGTDVALALRGRRLQVAAQKPAVEYLTEQKQMTIRPAECEGWIQERVAKNDLFMQKGQWSTIHIESPLVSIHVEYRRNNLDRDVEGQCSFQSLDAWMTRVSKELHDGEWNGILGETRFKKEVEGRLNILRGQKDEDYEVSGPFATDFPALHMN